MCDVCEDGYDKAADGSCAECGVSSMPPWFILAVLGGVLFLALSVSVLRRSKRAVRWLRAVVTLGRSIAEEGAEQQGKLQEESLFEKIQVVSSKQ